MEELKEELAKKKKPKKPKPGEIVEPDYIEADYRYLEKGLLKRMLTKRLEEEDCNAGVIFDNLKSEFWKDEKECIELVCETCPAQNVQMVLFSFQTER